MTVGRRLTLMSATLALLHLACSSSSPSNRVTPNSGAGPGAGSGFAGTSTTLVNGGRGGLDSAGTAGATGGGSGNSGSGGAPATGGTGATGGSNGAGGTAGLGGTTASGGATGTAGVGVTGGMSGGGGRTASGGASATGGAGASTGGQSGASGSTSTGGSTSGGTRPCDIYAAGNTPCTAAFSSVRALYGAYNGNLYQVKKADGTTKDIGVVSVGDIADAAAQDAFCAGTACTVSIIYDQSGNANHLKSAPKGGKYGPYDCIEAVADALPIKIGGKKAYGIHIAPSGSNYMNPYQTAYRNNQTTGTATGDTPESIYMVADGTYYNDQCCFDFGNAETTGISAGPKGSMHALYLGNCTFWNKGAGSGPWIMADLESGLFNTTGAVGATNNNDPSMAYAFVTAMTKNNAAGKMPGPFTLKGGNGQSGMLTTFWDGARPTGYDVMVKQGAIVLGIGGDTGSGARGNFFEGAMTNGFASTETDNAVQANIVAAAYSK